MPYEAAEPGIVASAHGRARMPAVRAGYGRLREEDMTVELNHTIIWAKDKWASARFLAHILGVEAGPQWARFVPVRVGGVTLDFADSPERHHQHYAFLIGEEEFDAAFGRVRAAGVKYYADHDRSGAGEINHYYGGRGVYFDTPDGNLFELITQPYGAVPESRGGRDAAEAG
jgi:catechol 2,3-dioxygenase-like lactoylglutathione lyase family enzyme